MNAKLKDLKTSLQNADPADDQMFSSIISEALAALDLTERQMGDELGVSRPSINRYKRGLNLPYTAMRKPIYDHLLNLVNQKV